MTILVCKCKRTGCLAATQVPEKGMNVCALAFFTGWLRGSLEGVEVIEQERALLAFLCAAAASLEGVEVIIEQASPEGDHAANGLAEVGVREVKAQTRVLKSHLEERDSIDSWIGVNHLRRGWFDTQRIDCQGTEFSDAQESVGGVKLLNLERESSIPTGRRNS